MKKCILPAFFALPVAALALEGISFNHKDWEVACDNTGTCRMAGYQHGDGDEAPISVLLTRTAGADAPVSGEIRITPLDWEQPEDLPRKGNLLLNGQSLGMLSLQEGHGKLTDKQVKALLKALPRRATVQVRDGENEWRLSDQGAAAVFLKADEFQGRIDTPSALVKTGASAKAVLAPQAKPVIHAVAVPEGQENIFPKDPRYPALKALIMATPMADDCDDLQNLESSSSPEITLYPLDDKNVLAEAFCFLSAYNSGSIYTLLSADLKTARHNVGSPDTANIGYENGVISAAMKQRGVGDCWSFDEYIWDGKTFSPLRTSYTGMCKGFPGGAWELPLYLAETRPAH